MPNKATNVKAEAHRPLNSFPRYDFCFVSFGSIVHTKKCDSVGVVHVLQVARILFCIVSCWETNGLGSACVYLAGLMQTSLGVVGA